MARTTVKSRKTRASNSQNAQQNILVTDKSEMEDVLFEDEDSADFVLSSASSNVVARRRIELYWEKKRLMREIGGIESLDEFDS